MKIIVDRSRCTGTGICESLADTYFEVGDDGVLCLHREDVQQLDYAQVEEAILSCPTNALSLRGR